MQKISTLGQKLWPTGREQTHTHTDTQTNIDRVQKRMMKTINEMSIPEAGVEISILRRRTAQRLKLKLHFAVLWICCKATSGRIK